MQNERYGDLGSGDYRVLRVVNAAEVAPNTTDVMFDARDWPGAEIVLIPTGGASFTADVGRLVTADGTNGVPTTSLFVPTRKVNQTTSPAFLRMNGGGFIGARVTLISTGTVQVLARGLGRGRVRAPARPMGGETYSGLTPLVPDMTIANAEQYTVVGAGAAIEDTADGLRFTVPAGAAGDDPDLIAFASWRARDQRGNAIKNPWSSAAAVANPIGISGYFKETVQSSIADIGVVFGVSNVANIASAATYSVFWRAHRTSTARVCGIGRLFSGVVSAVTNDATPLNTPRIWHCSHSDLQAGTFGTLQCIGLTATGTPLGFDPGVANTMNVGLLPDNGDVFVYVAAYRSALTAGPGTQTFKPRYLVRNPLNPWL